MLAYLRATSTIGLRYKGEVPGTVPSVMGMCDASFAVHEDCASQSGFYFTLCGAAISWKSNKIRKIVLSSTEAEYVAASDASRQAECHRNVLVELGLFSGGAVQVRTDNKGVQALVGDPVQRQRTKHIGSHYHYVRQLVDGEVVDFQRVTSKENVADVLTKGSTRPFHSFACRGFGLTTWESSAFLQR